MSINRNEITKEMLVKAMQCHTAEELMALAKSEDRELTKEEAEAYLAEIDDCKISIYTGTCRNRKSSAYHNKRRTFFVLNFLAS